MKKTVVLIPCYNEEITVGSVIRDYQRVLPDSEIIVIDNNCTDRTAEIAASLGSKVLKVKEQGKGCALRGAFRAVEAEAYVMVDGDDTYPPDETLHRMRDMVLNEGYDMVIGNRLDSDYFKENKSFLHGLGNRIVPFLFKKLYNVNIGDIMSGSRVLSQRFVSAFPAESDGFVIETEMMIYAAAQKMKVAEIPIHYKDRPKGSCSKINALKDGSEIIHAILRGRKNRKG